MLIKLFTVIKVGSGHQFFQDKKESYSTKLSLYFLFVFFESLKSTSLVVNMFFSIQL